MKPVQRRGGGFTMVELLVVMTVLGVLAAAVLPLGETLVVAQKEAELRRSLLEIRDALDRYRQAVEAGEIERLTESGYPPNLEVLVEGTPAKRSSVSGQRAYFLRRIPNDPFVESSLTRATWRLRSYASPPDLPRPGNDVFDVLSSSDGTALDGSKYRDW